MRSSPRLANAMGMLHPGGGCAPELLLGADVLLDAGPLGLQRDARVVHAVQQRYEARVARLPEQLRLGLPVSAARLPLSAPASGTCACTAGCLVLAAAGRPGRALHPMQAPNTVL